MPRPFPVRPGARHRRVIRGVVAGAWASGAGWLVLHHFLSLDGPFGPAPHPLEPWALRLHGLFAFAAMGVLGSLLTLHVPGALSASRRRASGLASLTLLVALALTGYALYYFATEANQSWLPILHWGPGLALPLVLWAHLTPGKRQRPAVRRPLSRGASA